MLIFWKRLLNRINVSPPWTTLFVVSLRKSLESIRLFGQSVGSIRIVTSMAF